MIEYHPMDALAGWWVMPDGEIVKMDEDTHFEYAREHPELFGIDEDEDLPHEEQYTNIFRDGAIRLCTDYSDGTGIYIDGLIVELDTSKAVNLSRLANALREIGFTDGDLYIGDPIKKKKPVITRVEDFIHKPHIDWVRRW